MISTINEVFTEVRENELYSYDKELVDFAKSLLRKAGKIITGKYDDDDDDEDDDEDDDMDDKKKVSFEFDDDDIKELNLANYKDSDTDEDVPECMSRFEDSMERLLKYINALEINQMWD